MASVTCVGRSAPPSGAEGSGETQEARALVSPVAIEGRKIAVSFWGRAWCEISSAIRTSRAGCARANLSPQRLGGRLADRAGKVEALVSGSEIYRGEGGDRRRRAEALDGNCLDCAGSVRLAGRALAGQAIEERDGTRVPGSRRPVPDAGRDQDVVLLPRLGGHVQARRGDALWRRGPARLRSRSPLHAARGRSRRTASVAPNCRSTRTAAASERVLADDDVAALFGIEIAAPDASPSGQSREEKRQARGPAAAAGPAHPKKPGRAATKAGAGRRTAARRKSKRSAKATA